MKKTDYQIEYDINLIEQGIRSDYDLPDNWYGDTYGSIIENKWGTNYKVLMKSCSQKEYDEYLEEIKQKFIWAAEDYIEREDDE